jgi:deferrochelatase/peroxidase EfeB
VGAHIRRANPRDSLADGLGISRRRAQELVDEHRILRRGRVYVDEANAKTGLMFICLNANIERQFEFVQSTWLMNPEFAGLQDETDPLMGNGAGRSMTLQRPVLNQCVRGLSQFVTVKGGGYFFLPGITALKYLAELSKR